MKGGRNSVRVGALAPLSHPGWLQAGKHLVAGLELAVEDVNDAGGIAGVPLELVIRDSAADPNRAAAAVKELAFLGVSAVVGEYHSLVARAAAATAQTLKLPFLCSSAVIDAITEQPSQWVARLAPPQSLGWRVYADFLLARGHRRVAVATQGGEYWAAGANILRDRLACADGVLVELNMHEIALAAISDELVHSHATALLLLVGNPEPAVSIVKRIRSDPRVARVLIGAPAGQPEFSEWARLLGVDAGGIPFLRYLPETLSALGLKVQLALRQRLGESPSFVGLEGYDSIIALSELLRKANIERNAAIDSWSRVSADGTRGHISFSRPPGTPVWQCELQPVQIVERDPLRTDQYRTLVPSL